MPRKLCLALWVVVLALMLDINGVGTMPKPFGYLHVLDRIRLSNLPTTTSDKNDASEATTRVTVTSPTITPPPVVQTQTLSRRNPLKITPETPVVAITERASKLNDLESAATRHQSADFKAITPPPVSLAGFLGIEKIEPAGDTFRKMFQTPAPIHGQSVGQTGARSTSYTNNDIPRRSTKPSKLPSSTGAQPSRRSDNHTAAEVDFKNNSEKGVDFLDWLRFSLTPNGSEPLSKVTMAIILTGLGIILFLFVFICCIHWYCN